MLSFNVTRYDVLFSASQVLWLRDLLWLLDDVTHETEALGVDLCNDLWEQWINIHIHVVSSFPQANLTLILMTFWKAVKC